MRRIVRILKVVDTREFEEGPDDKVRPIPGSGRLNVCDRCGREHEVHAWVLLEDGTNAIVGTGCGRKESADLAAKFTKADALAKRLARLAAKESAHNRLVAAWESARAVVAAMPLPPPVWSPLLDSNRFEVHVGDGRAFSNDPAKIPDRDREERENCARSNWQANRMAELGQSRWCPRAPFEFARRRAQIVKAMAAEGIAAA